jgi:hypothetical protein
MSKFWAQGSDKLVKKLGKEGMGRLIVEHICPGTFDLSTSEDCTPNLQNCTDCWAGAMGLEQIELRRHYEEIFDVLIEKLGKEELSRTIIDQECPSSFDLLNTKPCGTYPQNCSKCWTKAVTNV